MFQSKKFVVTVVCVANRDLRKVTLPYGQRVGHMATVPAFHMSADRDQLKLSEFPNINHQTQTPKLACVRQSGAGTSAHREKVAVAGSCPMGQARGVKGTQKATETCHLSYGCLILSMLF